MFMVGYCYVGGTGVSPDLDEAKKWLRMAADGGIQDASDLLAELE
jgi:TPR repeat protein